VATLDSLDLLLDRLEVGDLRLLERASTPNFFFSFAIATST